MKSTARRLGRLGTVAAIASAMSVIVAGPAWAGSQWPNCYHFQTGWTKWKAGPQFEGITGFNGIWEDRNGNLVRSETQYLKYQENMKLRIYGEGNATWALAGVSIDTDNLAGTGAYCEGPDASVTDVVFGPLSENLPLDTLNAVPPLPSLAFVIMPEDVA